MSKSVLIIDDDEDDRFFFCEAVSQIDHSITCLAFANALQALDRLTNMKDLLPDYIFLDLNLPRVHGKECLLRLKQNKKLKDIPVIIYSTSKRQEDKEETKKLGAAYFLTKPSMLSVLVSEIIFIFSQNWHL